MGRLPEAERAALMAHIRSSDTWSERLIPPGLLIGKQLAYLKGLIARGSRYDYHHPPHRIRLRSSCARS